VRDEAEHKADRDGVEIGARRRRDAGGVRVRPLEPGDAAGIADLVNEFDRTYVEDPDTIDAAEVSGWWLRIDKATSSRVYTDDDGTIAAVGTLNERNDGMLDLDAYVRPVYQGKGLGSAFLEWLEEEAHSRGRSFARTSALAADAAAVTLITGRGFEPIRHFYRMVIDLDGPPPEPVWPDGFTVSTAEAGEEKIVHAVTQEAFADHWGHVHREFDEWREFRRNYWDPSLVYIVRTGDGEVVAAEVNALRFGAGWVDTIGTLKPWRGRGIGRALLLEAFGELYRRGEHRIALAVDAGNETGATHLYESVGMRIAWQADVYEKHL
jgi:mycothiol synthase